MELLPRHIEILKAIKIKENENIDPRFLLQGLEKSGSSTSLFMAKFLVAPNRQYFYNIELEKCFDWFLETYKEQIYDYLLFTHKTIKENKISNIVFFFGLDFVMEINFDFQLVLLNYKKTSLVELQDLVEEIDEFDLGNITSGPVISLLSERDGQIETEQFIVNSPTLTIEEAYQNNFLPIHEKIENWIQDEQSKGLLLLHGKPGTGKTSYLKHLMTKVAQTFIYVPSDFFYCLSLPRFSNFLINNKNAVFIIEDAERLLMDRKINQRSEVSSILNLCDGFLADAYGIKIICTFNTSVSNLDTALLRKGRLFGMYEFKELGIEKANHLSHKLNFNMSYDSPQLLAEICNPQNLILNADKTKTMGFEINILDN